MEEKVVKIIKNGDITKLKAENMDSNEIVNSLIFVLVHHLHDILPENKFGVVISEVSSIIERMANDIDKSDSIKQDLS